MRTRTSWRNQDKLFKDLFAPKDAPVRTAPTVESISRMLETPFLSKASRSMLQRDLERARVREALS